jgi:hypothetical protein
LDGTLLSGSGSSPGTMGNKHAETNPDAATEKGDTGNVMVSEWVGALARTSRMAVPR